MAMQTGILAGKLGQKLVTSHNEVKDVPVEHGMIGLPAGIENGTAQLRGLKIDVYKDGDNKGKPYFSAMGIVVKPHEHGGSKVEGLMTRIGPEPLFDTPNRGGDKARKTFTAHWNWMLDQLAMLAGDDNFKARIKGATPQEIEASLLAQIAGLQKAQPHFRFRTWSGSKQVLVNKGGKWFVENQDGRGAAKGPYATEAAAKAANRFVGTEPMVNHQWAGVVDFSANGQPTPTDHVQEDTASTPPDEAQEDAPAAAAEQPSAADSAGGGEESAQQLAELGELVAKADRGDKPSALKVQSLGSKAGLSDAEMEEAANYAAIGDLIRAKLGGEEETPAEEGEDDEAPPDEEAAAWEPAEGDKVGYQVLDKAGEPVKGKNGKVLNPVPCEVVKVDKKAKTVNLTAAKDKSKHYNNKAWDSPQIVRE